MYLTLSTHSIKSNAVSKPMTPSKTFDEVKHLFNIHDEASYEYKALWKLSYLHLVKTGELNKLPGNITKTEIIKTAEALKQKNNYNQMVNTLIKGLRHQTKEYNNYIAREAALGLTSLFKADPSIVTPELIRLLQSPSKDHWLKEMAANALKEYPSPKTIAALHKAALNDTPSAVHALAQILGEKSLPYLAQYLEKGSTRVKLGTIYQLDYLGTKTPAVIPLLKKAAASWQIAPPPNVKEILIKTENYWKNR